MSVVSLSPVSNRHVDRSCACPPLLKFFACDLNHLGWQVPSDECRATKFYPVRGFNNTCKPRRTGRRGGVFFARRGAPDGGQLTPRRYNHQRSATSLQHSLQEYVYFGDRLGDKHSLARQGSQADTTAYLQISRYFCFRRHSNAPHDTGHRLIEPTPMRPLVYLLVSSEQPRPNGTRSKAI